MLILAPFLCATLALADPSVSISAFRAAIASAGPGDRVTLAPGEYQGQLFLHGVRGEPGRPVVIAGSDPANPPIIRGGSECLHLVKPAHVVVEDFILEGAGDNGLNIDDGGDLAEPASDITLRRIQVRHIGPEGDRGGNHDGIKLSGLSGFLIESCVVEQWGRGGSGIDMVGCRNGLLTGCRFRNGDTDGASGIQMKGGTRRVIVRSCRFDHAGRRAVNIGGSTGLAYFRPRPEGFEAAEITIEGCTIVGSESAVAFVGVDGADVRSNTIYHPARWALRILQETREPGFVPCRGGRFAQNIVVFDSPTARAANIGDATDPASFKFERNVWFWSPDPSRVPDLPTVDADGVFGRDPRLRNPEHGDFVPDPDGPGCGRGASAFVAPSPDGRVEIDNHTPASPK